MSDWLVVNEIFLSIQGESIFAGLPCVMVRLTGCDLRCSYCDTVYAFTEGRRMALSAVVEAVDRLAAAWNANDAVTAVTGVAGQQLRLPLVELTGGEPLLQRATPELLRALCERGYTVLLETNGAHDITGLDEGLHRIVDLKCPSSGEAERNRWANLAVLTPRDQVKFVIASEEDYQWARAKLFEHRLAEKCTVLFSWADFDPTRRHPLLNPFPAGHRRIALRELAERILADRLPVRLQIQLHKVIWPGIERGV